MNSIVTITIDIDCVYLFYPQLTMSVVKQKKDKRGVEDQRPASEERVESETIYIRRHCTGKIAH